MRVNAPRVPANMYAARTEGIRDTNAGQEQQGILLLKQHTTSYRRVPKFGPIEKT